jgi:hypothetical protein
MRSYRTNLLRGISVSVLSLLVLAASASAQGPLYTFRADGSFANVYTFEFTGSSYKSLSASVSLGGTLENPSTFLYYSISEQSNGVYTAEYGYGLIPNDSVSPGGGKHLTLDVDVSAVPDFRTFRVVCSIGTLCLPTPSAPPADGSIALAWDKTPDRWYRSEGHSVTQLYDLILHSQGTSASFSATAQGTLFGRAIAAGYTSANIGTNRNLYMAVEHEQ